MMQIFCVVQLNIKVHSKIFVLLCKACITILRSFKTFVSVWRKNKKLINNSVCVGVVYCDPPLHHIDKYFPRC